ncbi:protein gprD [Aspergillus ruber CBS 135680]|uniref:G protein-coupled receptor GprD n=1 Tax=Aspergillus ruber (strain CBS 135680) TaxID=1388766 RepID=A0A017SLB3_ASPRC|nr:G protein-coupled receptor GprD [Aspergillus ruber CBS 135680]EYE97742.1 G protein-coupled receptor GprD [Aspergillus ruber CBS 135680]
MGILALISWVSSFALLSFLTYRFIFWQRYYKRPLAENQYVVLIYNLLLVDLQQASAFLICLHWVTRDSVNFPSAACVLQGWWIQIADPGSGLFVLAIAVHTADVVLRGRQLPFKGFVACVCGLWAFIIMLGLIPVGMFTSNTFVVSEAGWCWLSQEYETERLWVHYLWIFISEFGTVVLYGFLFIYLRRRMKQASMLRQQHQDNLKRLNRVVVYMVIYPFVYVVLSLPLAAGRMATARHVAPSKTYFAVAGSLMALSGFMDVAVYTLTRRHLLIETDESANDNAYVYTDPKGFQTHISTTGGKEKKFRVGNKMRRGLQTVESANDTVNDDRDDSTEDIMRKGDMEMNNLAHGGVYQETTIEISSEPVEPADQLKQQQQHRLP